MQVQQERGFWANQVESPSHHHLPPSPSRNTTVLKKIRSALRPTHRQVSQQGAAAAVVRAPQQLKAQLKLARPVLAEVEGNRVTNRYNFSTVSPLFRNGSLGSLSIFTSYVRLRPRKLTVVLSDVDGSEETLYSKEPDWNQLFNLYELDFGGRVNRDSIKNCQVERKGEVVS